ncbi:MAG: leucine-rich repeat protein [Lachnospiraceae bacterium]|nr:leucine-rich repeat protein [Lachnospiraceae bacterium]
MIRKKEYFNDQTLERIIVPEKTREIGDWAFARCRNLKSAALPAGLERIGREAFAGCDRLKDVYIYDKMPPDDFSGQNNGRSVLAAIAFRYFDSNQLVWDALKAEAAGDTGAGFLRLWDELCESFLNKPDEDGFQPFLAGGEEDYPDEKKALAQYCEQVRFRKAEAVWFRLLLGQQSRREFYLKALLGNDTDLVYFRTIGENCRTAAEIYREAGLLTEEKIPALLRDIPEEQVELRTALIERGGRNPLEDLFL